MTDAGDRTFDQALASLRQAVTTLRSELASRVAPSEDDSEATRRLKADAAQLGQAAADALSTLGRELDEQRATVGSSADRERAERATTEIKSALSELVGIASTVSGDLAKAASKSVKQADPEITRAIGALEDVIASATTWIRLSLDSTRDHGGDQSAGRLPLDDL